MNKFIPAATLVAALSTAGSSAAQFDVKPPPVIRANVKTISAPKVTSDFRDAVAACIRSKNNSLDIRTPGSDIRTPGIVCKLPTSSLDSDQNEFLRQEGFVAQNRGTVGDYLLTPTSNIVMNRATINSVPSPVPSTLQRCTDLLQPGTTISSGGGRMIIGSVVTDGYNGSMVNGVRCENR